LLFPQDALIAAILFAPVLKSDGMPATIKSLLTLTAGDLMSRDLVLLTEDMPLREAARLLVQNQIGGAPVLDAQGKCVGVISVTDFLRIAEQRVDVTKPTSPPLPVTCSFQTKHRMPDGREVILCNLPPGVCPIQGTQKSPDGKELVVCRQPRCVVVDWQIVALENLPTHEVRNYMTPDPVMVKPDVSVRNLARRMIDAHIHRIIVVDDEDKPIGIVTSTSLLAAMAYAAEGE
jgi:CBS domain-containing protein